MALAFLLAAGCGLSGPKRYHVSGTVTVNSEPVEEGTIEFHPIEGSTGPLAGSNIKDGVYDVPKEGGPLAGTYRVQIQALRDTGRTVTNMGGDPMPQRLNFLPPEYSGPASELRAEIGDDSDNTFDFALEAGK